jgi:hypothetical protein
MHGFSTARRVKGFNESYRKKLDLTTKKLRCTHGIPFEWGDACVLPGRGTK